MFQLFQSEVFRLRKRAQSWILIVLTFLLVGVFYGGFTIGSFFATGANKDDLLRELPFDQLSDFGLSIGLGFFGGVMLVIVAAGMMGNEFSWNTLRPLVARASSRSSLLTAKLLALLLYTVVFSVIVAILVGVLSIVSSLIAGVDVAFSGGAVVDAAWFTLRMIVASLPYLAFAFMLATVVRSNAAGIAGALGLSFLEPTVFGLLGLISSVFHKIEKGGISYNQSQLMTWNGWGDEWVPLVILLAYTVLFLAISFWVFLRRDVTSG
ncbi:MAG TPA: ABC transporter permease subunit [Thermomicrobiales bacterium]|nr:ABC transporter permease subunit [Thermomicrobiales bacterium]